MPSLFVAVHIGAWNLPNRMVIPGGKGYTDYPFLREAA